MDTHSSSNGKNENKTFGLNANISNANAISKDHGDCPTASSVRPVDMAAMTATSSTQVYSNGILPTSEINRYTHRNGPTEENQVNKSANTTTIENGNIEYSKSNPSWIDHPSTSSFDNTNSDSRTVQRPSSLKLNQANINDDSSSDTGNDDYSLGSQDGCIYTYRGGEHLADLPSSFFSLDMGLPLDLPIPPNYSMRQEHNERPRSRASSPEMDFLEMDFDPGPSCEADTGEDSSPDVDLHSDNELPLEQECNVRGKTPESSAVVNPILPIYDPGPSSSTAYMSHPYDMPSTSGTQVRIEEVSCPEQICGPYITHVNFKDEHLLVRRTMCHGAPGYASSLHLSSGDLVSPKEVLNQSDEEEIHLAYQINQGERPFDPINLSSALYHLDMAKKFMADKTKQGESVDVDHLPESENTLQAVSDVPQSMVWSECEACERQVTQIGTSACGATAVINVFNALGVPVNIESVNNAVGTRLRANHAPLPRYLLSRAVAGCTAADIVNGLQRASDGLVSARFFHTYPERIVSLSHWLADWISIGAVPILTLNLQIGTEDIPDAWHHQMVFGVSTRGIYLCNPLECVKETAIWCRLTSPSVLLVRTKDVLSRYNPKVDLTPLMVVPDRRFHSLNVLGQVVNVIREWRASGWSEHRLRTRHIRIPAAYQAGVTIATLTGSEAHRKLKAASQLPILKES